MSQISLQKIIQVQIIGMSIDSLSYKLQCEDYVPQIFDIVEVEFKTSKKLAIITKILNEYDGKWELKNAYQSIFEFSKIQKILLDFISKYYLCNIGITAQIFRYITKNIDNISHKTTPIFDLNTLSKNQQKVLDTINLNMQKNKFLNLIFGDTGSGKTEIYIHLIKQNILQNKQTLFLMPEISLSLQTELRLKKAFGDNIGIWHSKKTKKYKEQVLNKLLNGEIKIIAGARSALFLPFTNLSLIIVDEEHDHSYKSLSNPKYHARDLAMYLSKKNITIVLGSATPDPNSYYFARKNNALIRLKNSYFHTKNEIILDKENQAISSLLISHITKALLNEKQIIIFIPTRANFKTIICRECANAIKCPNCSVSLSLHSKNNALICHYCNYSQAIPSLCPQCNGELMGMRLGTEEMKNKLDCILNDKECEDLLDSNIIKNINKKISIKIFDRDNMTTHKKIEKTLGDFRDGKIDILIGTQMIAKGHDYPRVGLSIIIGIDFFLQMQTFMAKALTYSLIFQVSGRSGRSENGINILQSKNEFLLEYVKKDYEEILLEDLDERQNLYPPFFKIALIKIFHKNEHIALSITKALFSELKESNFDIEVVGYCECEIFKIKNIFYYQIFLRSNKRLELQRAIAYLLGIVDEKIKRNIDIDIDSLLV